MLIGRWMTRNPATVGPNQTLAEARRMMEKGNFRRLPVVESERLVGIITDRDLRQHIGQLVLLRYEISRDPYLAGTFTFWAG
jgi:CBS domain-containing protein